MAISVLDTAYGRMLLPDTDNSQFTWLQMTGTACEDADIRLVRDILGERAQGTIIDAGASFGTWALNRLGRKAAAYNCALWSKRRGFDIAALDLDRKNNFGGLSLLDGGK